METLKSIVYILSILPIPLLVIYTLFVTLKRPSIVSKGSKDSERDKLKLDGTGEAFMSIFYTLGYLKKNKKYKTMYYIGLIGIIGSSILLIGVIIYSYLVIYILPS